MTIEHDEAQMIQRMGIELRAKAYPASAAEFQESTQRCVLRSLRMIEESVSGTVFPGCFIDEDSMDELLRSFAAIQATLDAAKWMHDSHGKAKLISQLAAFDARNDRQLQAWLEETARGAE